MFCEDCGIEILDADHIHWFEDMILCQLCYPNYTKGRKYTNAPYQYDDEFPPDTQSTKPI